MKLQTIRKVSTDFGISRRMLCYYEEIGLIKSVRKDDYAYRLYEESEIRRLQQIIILRKLQIPMKQIKDILNNQDAVTAIEIFKQSISELDEEITALSVIKSILVRFIDELQEKTNVQLKFDLLNDKTMLTVVETLPFTKHNIKERMSMAEINAASETLANAKEKHIRIVYTPTEMVACLYCEQIPPRLLPDENAKNVMEKFIRDVDLIKIKPDFKVFSNSGGDRKTRLWVTIPDELEVPEPFVKETFLGGLWAVYTITPENIDDKFITNQWARTKTTEYQWDAGYRPNHDVYFNPLNICGFKNTNQFDTVFNSEYFDEYEPIREIENLSDEQMRTLDSVLKTTEKSISQGKTTQIDLTTMAKNTEPWAKGNMVVGYENGLLKMTADDWGNGMATAQHFKLPLKINVRAKTNKEINIKYGNGSVVFRNAEKANNDISLPIWDISSGIWKVHKHGAQIPCDEFVDFEFLYGRDVMAVKVNGEIRNISNDNPYIIECENPDFVISSPVTIEAITGSTVVVESIWVTEIE